MAENLMVPSHHYFGCRFFRDTHFLVRRNAKQTYGYVCTLWRPWCPFWVICEHFFFWGGGGKRAGRTKIPLRLIVPTLLKMLMCDPVTSRESRDVTYKTLPGGDADPGKKNLRQKFSWPGRVYSVTSQDSRITYTHFQQRKGNVKGAYVVVVNFRLCDVSWANTDITNCLLLKVLNERSLHQASPCLILHI